jgi:membrane protease YdiL (CAAX protease family)
VYIGSKRPEFNSIYPLVQNSGESIVLFFKSSIFYFLYYIGYEFCFRGFLFMGIREDVGDAQALGVSLAVTVLLHVTQPQSEMIMAFIVGIAFPVIVKKLKTLWPAILIHAYAGIALDYWCIINRGGFGG